MASRIILDPETLLAQAGEMQNLTAEYEALFSKVTGTLNDTNNHWSELLAHNFAGKISSAQQSFTGITELLSSGAAAAKNSAATMQSVDQSLVKVFGGEAGAGISSGQVQGVIDVIEDYIELNIQNAAALDGATVWDEEKTIAENSVTTEEDIKEAVGEDAQITEFQNNVEEITFLGEKHYAAQYTFKNYDVPFYGVTVYLVNKQDPCYLLAVNILGSDLDAVDQADQFFSIYTE